MPRGSSSKRERQYELYGEARRRDIHGRSSMNKSELKRSLGR
jgi:hypothetical protein